MARPPGDSPSPQDPPLPDPDASGRDPSGAGTAFETERLAEGHAEGRGALRVGDDEMLGVGGGEIVIPIAEERATIGKRDRIVGRVRVSTVTREEEVELTETLRSSRIEIERVAVGTFVEEVPEVREEGGVTIIPVIEEVLVRRLVLREEIHLRRIDEDREVRETVMLRTQDPVIERDPVEARPDAGYEPGGA